MRDDNILYRYFSNLMEKIYGNLTQRYNQSSQIIIDN